MCYTAGASEFPYDEGVDIRIGHSATGYEPHAAMLHALGVKREAKAEPRDIPCPSGCDEYLWMQGQGLIFAHGVHKGKTFQDIYDAGPAYYGWAKKEQTTHDPVYLRTYVSWVETMRGGVPEDVASSVYNLQKKMEKGEA